MKINLMRDWEDDSNGDWVLDAGLFTGLVEDDGSSIRWEVTASQFSVYAGGYVDSLAEGKHAAEAEIASQVGGFVS